MVKEPCARCLQQEKTLRGYGGDSVEGQSGYRTEIGRYSSRLRYQGMAATGAPTGQARLRIPRIAPGGVRRWLFLARMQVALPYAKVAEGFLGAEDRQKQGARPGSGPASPSKGLAGSPLLGTRASDAR